MEAVMSSRPEHVHYDVVEKWIRESIKHGHAALFDSACFDSEMRRLEELYDFPHESLVSFVRNCLIPHIKRTAPKVKAFIHRYVQKYQQGISILQLSKEANYSPHLFARYMVEELTQLRGKRLADALRIPETVLAATGNIVLEQQYRFPESAVFQNNNRCAETRLASEVIQAQRADPLNNPRAELERHMMGVEYECVLEFQLRELGIAFETEVQLRERGTSRTPDVLLSSPLAVQVPSKTGNEIEWKVVNWIDSKALFGDVLTHISVLPQAESYVHRFGSGLVLYWFGHAPMERLDDCKGDLTIGGWELPREFMLPDGSIIGTT